MAVSLPTDIIMDVARAADPEKVQAARDRLSAFASQGPASANFAAGLDAPQSAAGRAADPAGPFQQFEAFVLQSFIENMLPDENESVYGNGLAGDMWKSMMAEQLAGQMAKAGGIGIADRILTDYYARQQGDASAKSGAVDEKQDAETRNLTSQAIVHEIQRRIGDSLGNSDGLLTDRKQG